MELKDIERVYFVGIGGIGMSALARYFAHRGAVVCGYDRTHTNLTTKLEQEGIIISYFDDESSVPVTFHSNDASTLIVYTPAVPKNSVLLNYFQSNGFCLKKRAEVLGMISKDQFCIAVAGTHGKTTTSSMIAHLLTDSGYGCTAFLGGIATNYQSNFLFSSNNVVVVEADEYDRSFLTLFPDIAVVTSTDPDHLDIYGDEESLKQAFNKFAGQVKPGGKLYVKDGLQMPSGIAYSADANATIGARNIRVEDGCFAFDYFQPDVEMKDLRLKMAGKHNVENAVAAIAVAISLGVSTDHIRTALGRFAGVKRRFERMVENAKHVYIDDYAHHPSELAASFEAVRSLFPRKKLTVVFQPHLFSRTRDFADAFAEVLSTADQLILLDIYPARELPIPGIDAQFLLNKIGNDHAFACRKDELKEKIRTLAPELLLTVGAGDIDTMVEPLQQLLGNA